MNQFAFKNIRGFAVLRGIEPDRFIRFADAQAI
jgi:hypothetical protein